MNWQMAVPEENEEGEKKRSACHVAQVHRLTHFRKELCKNIAPLGGS